MLFLVQFYGSLQSPVPIGTDKLREEPVTGREVKENEIKLAECSKRKGKEVNHGVVSSEVIVGLPNELEIVSIVTKAAVENLGLKEGKEVYAVINAGDVVLATDY